jgi:hypothetical protein
VPESRIPVLNLELASEICENENDEGIGPEEPGIIWRSVDACDDKTALEYLYSLGKGFSLNQSKKVGSSLLIGRGSSSP